MNEIRTGLFVPSQALVVALRERVRTALVTRDPQIRRSLWFSTLDAVFYSIMVGIGEAFIMPMAVNGGLKGEQLGLLATVPLLLGAFLQTWSGTFLRWFGGSRKRFVVTFASVQAVAYLLLAGAVWFSLFHFWILLPIFCLYWSTVLALSPAWSSWMGSLTEGIPRGKYFAFRSQMSNMALLGASAASGWAMAHFQLIELTRTGFVVMFCLAFVARLVSGAFLAAQYEPKATGNEGLSFGKFLRDGRRILRSKEASVFLFLVAFNFAVHFSGAYFTPYQLNVLKQGLDSFQLVQCAAIAAKILFLPVWGRLIDIHGCRKSMILTAAFIAVVPVLWIPYGNVAYLCLIQVFSGIVWAGFELSSFNLMLGATAERERVSYWAWYNMLNGVGQVTASYCAGLLLSHNVLSYQEVFGISGALRFVAILLVAKFVQEVGQVTPISYHRLFFRVFAERTSFPGGRVAFSRRKAG